MMVLSDCHKVLRQDVNEFCKRVPFSGQTEAFAFLTFEKENTKLALPLGFPSLGQLINDREGKESNGKK